MEGAEVVWQPCISLGLVRFLDPRPDASPEDHDRFTDAVIRRVLAGGEAFFLGTTWRGRRAMRVIVLNWQTSEADVERALLESGRGAIGLWVLAVEGTAMDSAAGGAAHYHRHRGAPAEMRLGQDRRSG